MPSFRGIFMGSDNRKQTVNLRTIDFLNSCCKDNIDWKKMYAVICLLNRENIHSVFKYKKFSDDFSNELTCYRKDDELIGMIRPSYEEFLTKIQIDLNEKPCLVDDDKLTNKLLNRVEVLRNISSEHQLREEFPAIYKSLQDGRNYIRPLNNKRKSLENELSNTTDTNRINEIKKELDDVKEAQHYYYSCAMQQSLPRFLKCQVDMYTRFIIKRQDIKKVMEEKNYNSLFSKYLNIDKLYMYIINDYLRKIEESKDKDEIKKYIGLIDKYLDSNMRKDYKIIGGGNLEVDLNSIKKRLENAKRRVADNSSEVDWILIPEGHDYSRARSVNGSPIKETILNMDEIAKLKQVGEAKNAFYESTNYLVKAVGLRKYHGYIAYIYPNGKVILDREYNKDNPNTALGDAIYIMNASDFEELSRLDKTTLMKDPRVIRVIHSKNWLDRTNSIIDDLGTSKSQEEAKQLVKRLKK